MACLCGFVCVRVFVCVFVCVYVCVYVCEKRSGVIGVLPKKVKGIVNSLSDVAFVREEPASSQRPKEPQKGFSSLPCFKAFIDFFFFVVFSVFVVWLVLF